jgi:hypothetical protein
MFRIIYIQLICVSKTRNGKLVALGWKQPLQEKLDIFSVLWNSVQFGEKGLFTRPGKVRQTLVISVLHNLMF